MGREVSLTQEVNSTWDLSCDKNSFVKGGEGEVSVFRGSFPNLKYISCQKPRQRRLEEGL